MGCDIHLHTEVKIRGEWFHYGVPDVARNYQVFAKMAGVRNSGDIEPLALPRGMPHDTTLVTRLDFNFWGSDAHSASWLSAEEITKLKRWIKEDATHVSLQYAGNWFNENFGYLFLAPFDEFTDELKDQFPSELEDVRFVFWFDD